MNLFYPPIHRRYLALVLVGSLSLLGVCGAEAATISLLSPGDDSFGETSFATGTNWTGGAAPIAGTDYLVTGLPLRTTGVSATAQTFAGASLTINSAGNITFKTSGLITINSLTLNGGSLVNAGLDGTSTGTANIRANITLGASGGTIGISAGTATEANARNFTVDSASTIVGAGGLSLNTYADAVTANVNIFTLSGTNTYTGGTTWSTASAGDTVILASNTALGDVSGTLNLNNTFGVLNLNNRGISIGRLVGLTGSVITGGTQTTDRILSVGNTGVGNNGSSATFAGIIQNGTGGFKMWLTKNGGNTQILSGTNTYTGQTTIQGGILSVATINNGGTAGNLGAATSAAGNLVLRNGTLQYTGAAASTDRLFAIGNNGGTLDASGSGAINFTNAGALTTYLSETGTRTFTLTGTNTGNNILNPILGDYTGATSLVKNGVGRWVLSGANTYTGGTTVNEGTLALGASNRLADTGAVAVSVGTLDLGGFSDTVGAFTLNSGTISNGTLTGTSYSATNTGTVSAVLAGSGVAFTKTGVGTVTLSGANTYTGVTTLTGGTLSVATIGNGGAAGNLGQASIAATNLVFNGGTLQYTGGTASSNRAFTINTGVTATIDVTTNNLSIVGATSTATTGALTKIGNGTLTLTGANTYTGGTTVNAGTLALGASDRLADTGAVAVSGGTLALGAFSDTVGAVTLTSGSITGSTGVLTGASYAVQSGSVSAILAGSGAVTKSTVDSVTFSAANTYTGTTLVSVGTLILSGSGSIAGSTTVDVASGATLSTSGITFGTGQTVKGKGTIIGDALLQGTLAAGNSPGILTFNDDLTLASSTDSIFEIENTGMVRGTNYDGVNVLGMLTYDGALTLTMTSLISDGTYNLFDFTSIAGDFDTVVFDGGIYAGTFTQSGGFWTATDTNGSGQTFSFELASGDLSVIPEPSTTLLLTGALMAAVIFRRRRTS